jgi:SAM-dependent methyltransferase
MPLRVAVHRARHRLWHARNDLHELHRGLVEREARGGGSFLDVGCMWAIHGANAFAAEQAGAGAVTALDVMARTPEFDAAHDARGSKVRFVRGDINDPAVVLQAGPHDVVWCSGVLYHCPDPFLTVRRLREVTAGRLLLATEVMPEVRGAPRSAALLPAGRAHPGAPAQLPSAGDRGYAPWYWLPAPSAVRAMLEAAGFRLAEEVAAGPYHRVFVSSK